MRRELKRKLDRLRKKIQAALCPLDPKERETRVARAKADDFYFYQTYLPYLFDQKSPGFHQELSAAFDLRNEIQAYAAPRGFGKTVITQGRQLKDICFGTRRHILAVSASENMAEDLVAPIKLHLEENERIIQDFGQLVKKGGTTAFSTTHGVKFTAKGRGQKIRGLHPDLVVLDDVEDDKQARNRARVNELLDWLLEVIYPALTPASAGGGTLIIIGTLLSRKSLLARLLDKQEFPNVVGRMYQAIQPDGTSLWETRHPLTELRRIKARIGSRRFNKEYQNCPQDEDSVFQEDWFLNFHPEELVKSVESSSPSP